MTTLICISTPSELSVTDARLQADKDPDHPGNSWMLFDSNNPGHYQVIFNNEQGQPEVAKYIKYISVGDGMAVQGCRKKGTPAYGMALHARAFPNVTIHQLIFPFCPPLDHLVYSPQYHSLSL